MTDTSGTPGTGTSAPSRRPASSCAPCRPSWASTTSREGLWDDRTLGQLLNDALLEDPGRRFRIWSPTNPYLGTVGEVYEEALRVAGGLRAHGLGPGDLVAFQLPNWVEAAITFYACTILGVTIVPIVHFYGPKEVGFILRQSGARALVIVSAYGKRDFLAELATIRDGLNDLEMVFVVGDTGGAPDLLPFDELRRRRADGRPRRRRPRHPGRHRLHVGHDGRPQGRRAHAPDARLRGAPAERAPGQPRPCRRSSARRSATPSACSAACSARWWAARRST